MKKIFQFIGLASFMLFSFYYTEKAALYSQEQNPIIKTINETKSDYNVESVNAIIEDNSIIPGINGKEVNINKSFSNMKNLGIFNKYYLIYDIIKPDVSLEENKDKTIIHGNKAKKEISIVINSLEHSELLNKLQVEYSYLATVDNYDKNQENIIKESDELEFNKLKKTINNNSDICLTNTNVNLKLCKENEYYLVKPSIILNNNLIEVKEELTNGSIIYINESNKIEIVNLLINEIKFKGYEIVKLSTLINESI